MNVLVATKLYSANHIWGISMAATFYHIIDMVNRVRDDVNWFFAVPETTRTVQWCPEDFKDLDRVTVLPVLSDQIAGEGKGGYGKTDYPFYYPKMLDLFVEDDYFKFDVFLSPFAHAQFVPVLQAHPALRLHHLKPRVAQPSIINYITETWVNKAIPPLDGFIAKFCHVASAGVSDINLVMTPDDVGSVLKVAKQYLSPSLVRGLDIRYMPVPVSPEAVPQYSRPAGRRAFLHGGTFEAARHLQWLAEQLRPLKVRYPDLTATFTTQRGTLPRWTKDMSHVDFVTDCTREEFYHRMGEADFIPCYVDYVGTGIAYTEAILSGLTPIIMKKPWNKGKFPENYPFLCNNEAEFNKALAFCAHNPASAKKLGQQCIDHVRKYYEVETQGHIWSSLLEDAVALRAEKTASACQTHLVYAIVEKALADLPERFDGEDALQAIANSANKLDEAFFKSIWWRTRQILLTLGTREVEGGSWQTAVFQKVN